MSLFQLSVVSKYLKTLDKQTIQTAYASFKTHFHNATIQENIRNSKEEQYQEGFLSHLFVNVLGYTLNPAPNFNLTTEHKNVKDSKKADGAIIFANKVKAVIELKGTNTTDLGNVEVQAFSYKNNQPECVYVITSNFEKLRFYIDNAIEFIEFNLFTLTESEFEMLYLCLALQSIEKGIPKKIKEESISHEDEITKKLYRDYSLFKRELHTDLVAQNPQYDALTLFKKSQKLLDRFLFLFFAEDRQLLPPNSVRLILTDWRILQEKDEEIPLYNRFKKYFGYLNTGYKGKRYDVFAYNGGLFKPDEILDSILIDDELLYKHTFKLSDYDFASEVDVNILGHIFENSLNELEELTAQAAGQEIDKSKTKRKRDGIVYTPKYITKYIVDNTVGRLCDEKKAELEINEEEYYTDKKRSKKATQILFDKLKTYRNWLLQITICDPACGSGAFLNQALNFLIAEHQTIDELQAKLFGDALVLSDIENTILENNLFGVDINEESVEIAKLSLWLRTAQPNRKLNDLSNNIKCGNSLIDDPEVAGDKAFNWGNEFPQIFGKNKIEHEIIVIKKEEKPDYPKLIKEKSFEAEAKAQQAVVLSNELTILTNEVLEISKQVVEYAAQLNAVSEPKVKYDLKKGGFDVVIGNPPYVRQELLGEYKTYFSKNYKVYNSSSDLFSYFYEKAFSILKPNGFFGFISNTFDKTTAGVDLRTYLKTNTKFIQYVDFTEVQIFEGATTYPIILITQNNYSEKNSFDYIKIPRKTVTSVIDFELFAPVSVIQKSLVNVNWTFKSINSNALLTKISIHKSIRQQYGKCFRGIVTGFNEAFIISKIEKDNILKESPFDEEIIKPFFEGKDLSKWTTPKIEKYLIFTRRGTDIEKYPGVKNWLSNYKAKLEPKNNVEQVEGRKAGLYKWFEIQDSVEYYKLFESPKITWPNLQNSNKFCFEDKGYYINAPSVIFPTNDKALLPILNSKLIWYFLKSICVVRSGGYIEVKPQYFEQLPVPSITEENKTQLVEKADLMLTLNKELQEIVHKFQRNLTREHASLSLALPSKLQNWHLLSYGDFIKELEKNKIRLTLSQKAEWETYFVQESDKTSALKMQIKLAGKEIDAMVYSLYDLTEEEIRIMEES